MNYKTLMHMSRLGGGNMSKERAKELIGPLNDALIASGCTTHARVAMWMAQTGEESVLWTASTEFASGAEYNWRSDLGNTHEGDGPRFKGRGFIQLTGRSNYTAFSKWAWKRSGLRHFLKGPNALLNNPERVSRDRFVWRTVQFYWKRHPQLNTYADKNDVYSATRTINGGTNGLDRRMELWNKYRYLGDALLPERKIVRAGKSVTVMFRRDKQIVKNAPKPQDKSKTIR